MSMTAIKFACVSPHPPIIVREVGRGRESETQRTIDALELLAAELPRHRPQTVLLMATHGPLNPGAFFLLSAPSVEGDFGRWGAPEVRLHFDSDPETVATIQEEAEAAGLPLDSSDRWNDGLDWSCTVPLYYLRCGLEAARLVPMNISFLSPQSHFQFGQAVRRAVDRLGRPVILIASADLSHRLSEDGPYGFDPAGPEFDRRIQDALAAWDVQAVLHMDPAVREAAGDDAVPSLSFLMGALDGLRVRPRILSYEGPFGVGYMVAAIDILEEDAGPAYAEAQAAQAEPVPSSSKEPVQAHQAELTEAGAGPSHPLARLAREAVEAYVLRRQIISPDGLAHPPDGTLPSRAGCFVSIKTRKGRLRGCIGSLEPFELALAHEVIRNAVEAASRDPRFLPITRRELPGLTYVIDVLAPPEPVDGTRALDARRYGVIVQNGVRRGLLLPDLDGVDTPEQQLAIARAKALIAPDEPVRLWRFQVRRLV